MQGKRYYYKFIRVVYFFLDLIVINSCFFASYLFTIRTKELGDHYYGFILAFNLIWFTVIFVLKAYEIRHVFSFSKVIKEIFQAIVIHFLIMAAIIFFTKAEYFSRYYFLVTYAFVVLFLPLSRLFLLSLLMLYRKKGFNYVNIILVGVDKTTLDFYNHIIEDGTLGLRVKGFFGKGLENAPENLRITEENDIEKFCLDNEVDRIYCTSSNVEPHMIQKLMNFADDNLIRFRIFPSLGNFVHRAMEMEFIEGIPVINVRNEPLENSFNKQTKRFFDIAFSIFVMLTVFPLLTILLGIIIKLESRGPIFFKQLRTGKDGKPFFCYKFRSMTVNDHSDMLQATKNDARLTKIGSLMRKTNLDEIPQFINVLRGEMSIVGPRPHMLKHSEEYSKIINRFYVRHFVKPGITGWAQVRGYRGATEDPNLMEKRVEHDVWYLENWNFWLDLRIIYMTVKNMVRGEENAF